MFVIVVVIIVVGLDCIYVAARLLTGDRCNCELNWIEHTHTRTQTRESQATQACLFVSLSACLSACLFVYLSVYLSVCQLACLLVNLNFAYVRRVASRRVSFCCWLCILYLRASFAV